MTIFSLSTNCPELGLGSAILMTFSSFSYWLVTGDLEMAITVIIASFFLMVLSYKYYYQKNIKRAGWNEWRFVKTTIYMIVGFAALILIMLVY